MSARDLSALISERRRRDSLAGSIARRRRPNTSGAHTVPVRVARRDGTLRGSDGSWCRATQLASRLPEIRRRSHGHPETHETAAIEPIPLARLEAWANKWHVQPTPGLQIISGYFARQDARYTLDVQVDGQGVVAVWKSGINGSREIQIARQWLDAVKARDVEALERLTSYPFEVRDAGRDALCGKRTATSQAELSGCLFFSQRPAAPRSDRVSLAGIYRRRGVGFPAELDWRLVEGRRIIGSSSASRPWSPRWKATSLTFKCWSLVMEVFEPSGKRVGLKHLIERRGRVTHPV